jgi:NTP pyrophosphatase (non-canonical NTP hydrolase)
MADRKIIIADDVNGAISDLQKEIARTINEKDPGSFASRHELEGVLSEEFAELRRAIFKDKRDFRAMRDELLDITVACVFGVACIDASGLEW